MYGLHTDLYQLTMAAGFHQAGKAGDIATFELFVRRFPPNRDILIMAGLPQAVDYLQELSYTSEETDYLKSLPQFKHAAPRFYDFLLSLRFTGDVWAIGEGTPFFPNEPILRVRAPLIQAQIVETYLISILSFQILIATKAMRVCEAAAGRPVIEFGTRRAHSPEAGVLAGRAACLGGCDGTSNVEAGFRYGVPVYGTCAHSWVMAFDSERESFRQLQRLLEDGTIYLVDTYDSLEGTRRAASLGPPILGIRLDSGDLAGLARECRRLLDDSGLPDARIMVSGDLNEYKIREMVAAGSPIDAFGVGTELATSSDAPNLSAVYKMVEIETAGLTRFTFKHSAEKSTLPGAKQVFRYQDRDVVGCAAESRPGAEPLLSLVVTGGSQVDELPGVSSARERCLKERRRILPGRRVEFSEELQALAGSEMSRAQDQTL